MNVITKEEYYEQLALNIASMENFNASMENFKKKYDSASVARYFEGRIDGILSLGLDRFFSAEGLYVNNFGISMMEEVVEELEKVKWPKWYIGPKKRVR